MAPGTVHARYIPVDTTPQSSLLSSFTVLRLSDQRHFLATHIPNTLTLDPPPHWSSTSAPSITTRLSGAILPSAAVPLSRILNHPNIISLVDIVQGNEIPGVHVNASFKKHGEIDRPNDFTVWENMDAGCLAYLLPNPALLPAFHDIAGWHALSFPDPQRVSLPESLCWHVLLSIGKALLWLHHGVKQTDGVTGEYMKHDEDWQPILVRDVSPGQVWFKHPVKGETYGECKLGGMQWAKVTGAPMGMIAMAERFEEASVEKQLYWAPEIYNKTALHTRASEIWSLGAVVYTMMTGIPPPRYYEYNWQISRMTDKGFSRPLREIVAAMLNPEVGKRPNSLRLIDRAEEGWRVWRTSTSDGREYVDLRDESMFNAYKGTSQSIIGV